MFYQTHTHNTCLKITRLVRWFLLSRNLSSSKYIVILIKTKNVGKKKFVLFSSLRTQDLYPLLKSPGPLSSPRRLWIYQST